MSPEGRTSLDQASLQQDQAFLEQDQACLAQDQASLEQDQVSSQEDLLDQMPPFTYDLEVDSGTYDPTPTMNFWLDVLLNIPGFPQTEEDAENILRFVRSQRDECQHTVEAVEQSIHQCLLQLQILHRNSRGTDNATHLRMSDLARRREELEQAEEALSAAELRVGAVRTLLRGRSLPLVFPHAQFRGFPPPSKTHYSLNQEQRDTQNDHVSIVPESAWPT